MCWWFEPMVKWRHLQLVLSIVLESLLYCVSCMLRLCSRVNLPCVLTCSRANAWCMLIFSRTKVSRELLNSCVNVPCVFTCSRANMLCVLSYSRANVPWVLMWLEGQHSGVLIYSRVNVPCELKCTYTNMPWVPCLIRLAWPSDHLTTCFAFSVSSFDVTFSISLQLLLKLYTLLVRFKSLIN